VASAVYTIDDEGFKKDSAVVGLAGEFVDHAGIGPVVSVIRLDDEEGLCERGER
jgi:hypothetical protein